MLFSSLVFLFYFLPLFLAAYFLIRPGFRNALLLFASAIFYVWGESWFVLVMVASILLDYVCALWMVGGVSRRIPENGLKLSRHGSRNMSQKAALLTSLCGNLGILLFFKYFNFLVDSYNDIVGAIGMPSIGWETDLVVSLPIGISFFTFQSMSYTIDVYRGEVAATRSLLNFSTFVSMFPQLVAGPVVRYCDIEKHLANRGVSLARFAYGTRRFCTGLAKKVLIANTVAVPADAIFSMPAEDLTLGLSWLGIACYTLQIYFDFSGYSDMAIGLGQMTGFRFHENFKHPYVSKSIREFWRRWHISMSTWFRDYLYIPLGGNKRHALVNLIIVFFLCGLWHGANYTFIVWGLFHGAFLVLERTRVGEIINRAWSPVRHVYVILVVMVGWVFFRADSLSAAMEMLYAMAGYGTGSGVNRYVGEFIGTKLVVAMLAGCFFSLPVFGYVEKFHKRLTQQESIGSRIAARSAFVAYDISLVVFLVISIMQLASGTHNPFIYFRF